MNLIIDVGNTFVKLAVFNNNELLDKISCLKKEFKKNFTLLERKYQEIEKVIFSSVGSFSEKEFLAIKKKYQVFTVSHNAIFPFKNLYKTPTTLGVDRLALITAAAVEFPIKNVLVIDAGSCITYDFIDKENEYLGGAISPGIKMRFKALHTFTRSLPLITNDDFKDWLGNSTKTSIQAGVVQGVLNEINGFISLYKKQYHNFTIILTGGDAFFLQDSLKNSIFADSNFLLKGLNFILELNTTSCLKK
ncbi:MAG: type III pantothenate kinase [Flavobacteriales bacterium]